MKNILILLVIPFLFSCKSDEAQIERWLVGEWNIDKYEQLEFTGNSLTSESESPNQGVVVFRKDGTGEDRGGNFEGSEFEWDNTNTKLILTAGGSDEVYEIEEFSDTNFIFSQIDIDGTNRKEERWFMRKLR